MRSPFKSSALPVARLLSDEPSEASIRWVMRGTWLMMILFVVVLAVGHVPRA